MLASAYQVFSKRPHGHGGPQASHVRDVELRIENVGKVPVTQTRLNVLLGGEQRGKLRRFNFPSLLADKLNSSMTMISFAKARRD